MKDNNQTILFGMGSPGQKIKLIHPLHILITLRWINLRHPFPFDQLYIKNNPYLTVWFVFLRKTKVLETNTINIFGFSILN
jgi:hypothetical protein